MITEPGLRGTVSPRCKPLLRAEPTGRGLNGCREAGSRGPEATFHPSSFDQTAAAPLPLRALQGGGESGGGEGEGPGRLDFSGIWSFHTGFVGH